MHLHARTKRLSLLTQLLALPCLLATGCGGKIDDSTAKRHDALIDGDGSKHDNIVKILFNTIEDGAPFNRMCTGALIAPRLVLTAEHCFSEANDRHDFSLQLHDIDVITESGHTLGVTDRYDAPDGSDVSIYVLDTYYITPFASVALYTDPPETLFGSDVYVVGYGFVPNGDETREEIIAAKENAPQTSAVLPVQHYLDDDSRLPLGANDEGQHITPGDSGGPAFSLVNGVPHVVGVSSWLDLHVPSLEVHAYYARVRPLENWVQGFIDTYADLVSDTALAPGNATFAAYTSEGLRLNDRARLVWDTPVSAERPACIVTGRGDSGPCASGADAQHIAGRLGVESKLHHFATGGSANLADRAHVTGNLVSVGFPSFGNGAQADGGLYWPNRTWPFNVEFADLRLDLKPGFIPNPLNPVSLAVDANAGISPGKFGNIILQPRSTLHLSEPGVYVALSLSMASDSRIVVDDDSENTYLYILTSINMNSGTSIEGEPESFLLGAVGETSINVDGFINATVVAPNASLDVKVSQAGNFYARRIELHQDRSIQGAAQGMHPLLWVPETTNW